MGCPMDYPAEIDLRPTLGRAGRRRAADPRGLPRPVGAAIDRVWAGLLPYTPDTAPIIDELEPGLFGASVTSTATRWGR